MSQPPWLNDGDDEPQWTGDLEVNGRRIKVRVSWRTAPNNLNVIRFVDPITGRTLDVQSDVSAWSSGGDDDAIPAQIVR
jgi:hypothetical protein